MSFENFKIILTFHIILDKPESNWALRNLDEEADNAVNYIRLNN